MVLICFGLIKLHTLNTSGFTTPNITNMASMFSNCPELVTLDLSSANTSKATRMESIFYGAKNLKHLDISNFRADASPNVHNMFNSCLSLLDIKADNFEFTKGTNPNIALSATFNRNTDIKVKNATEKAWFLSKYPTFTNVHE